ncbi:unnamed protein product, partial [Discosporangium mesarthrocarpum]
LVVSGGGGAGGERGGEVEAQGGKRSPTGVSKGSSVGSKQATKEPFVQASLNPKSVAARRLAQRKGSSSPASSKSPDPHRESRGFVWKQGQEHRQGQCHKEGEGQQGLWATCMSKPSVQSPVVPHLSGSDTADGVNVGSSNDKAGVESGLGSGTAELEGFDEFDQFDQFPLVAMEVATYQSSEGWG